MAAKKCSCNMGMWIVSIILMTVGLWTVVSGFVIQFGIGSVPIATVAQAVMPWYFVGLLFLGFGKMAKWKAFCACNAHGRR